MRRRASSTTGRPCTSAATGAAPRSPPTRCAMPEPGDVFVAGLVLAAGGSSRLGQPKQLLPFGQATLLDHTVATARSCAFDQLVVALGGAAEDVRDRVDLTGADVVVNEAYGEGCSSSVAGAMDALQPGGE